MNLKASIDTTRVSALRPYVVHKLNLNGQLYILHQSLQILLTKAVTNGDVCALLQVMPLPRISLLVTWVGTFERIVDVNNVRVKPSR